MYHTCLSLHICVCVLHSVTGHKKWLFCCVSPYVFKLLIMNANMNFPHRAHRPVYGIIAEVKLHKKGGYGFVKFDQHGSAVKAIVGCHGRQLHGRVSIGN